MCSPASVEMSQWRALSSSWWLPGCIGHARTVTHGTWCAMFFDGCHGMSLDMCCASCTSCKVFQHTYLSRVKLLKIQRSPLWHLTWSCNHLASECADVEVTHMHCLAPLKIIFLWTMHHFPHGDIHQNTQTAPKSGLSISKTQFFNHLTVSPTVNVYINVENPPFVHHVPQ